MFDFSDNFTDSKTILKKESRIRNKDDFKESDLLENLLWIALYKLGFISLNVSTSDSQRKCLLTFGKPNNIIKKKIDIVAESKDAIFIIKCTSQTDTTDIESEIDKWIDETATIRPFIQDKYLNVKNIRFIFFTDQPIPTELKHKLHNTGIFLLTKKNIKYLYELISAYPYLAYYQLLGMVFNGMKIVHSSEKSMSVPSLRYKYSHNEYCYLFAIEPSKLIPLSTVLHRKMNVEDDKINTYQRMVNKRKINKIKKFIEKGKKQFPTNILLSFSRRKEGFKSFGKDFLDNKFVNVCPGLLELPKNYGSITVVDGQHRLFAYDGLDESQTHLLNCIAFINMDINDQIDTFVDINDNQTSINASLMWDLYPFILNDDDLRVKISLIAKKLNDTENALFGKIKYDSAPLSDQSSIPLTLVSICKDIKKYDIIDLLEGYLKVLKTDHKSVETEKLIFDILLIYFNSLKKLDPIHWNKSSKEGILCTNQGIGALSALLKEIINYFWNEGIFEKIITNKSQFEKELENLLIPLKFLIKNKENKQARSEFMRVGEGGKKEIFIDFVRQINSSINNFGSELLKKENSQEIEDILQTLAMQGENTSLEVKDSFRVAHIDGDGKCIINDKMRDERIRTLVAFANTFGGRFIIGINDGNWNIVGLENKEYKKYATWEGFKKAASSSINSVTQDLPTFKIKRHFYDGYTIAVIYIDSIGKNALKEKKLAIHSGDNAYYKRVEEETIVIKVQDKDNYCGTILDQINANPSLCKSYL